MNLHTIHITMFAPISHFRPLEFLIPLLPKHIFSSSLSHKMKAMYFTVQFHRENILNDQQISQKHTFNGPFSARHNTVGEWDIAWWCTAYIALGRDWAELRCSAVSRLRKILYKKNLSLLLFWDVNIMGLGYSWWNMHLSSNMFILYDNLLFYIVICTLLTCSFILVFHFLNYFVN